MVCPVLARQNARMNPDVRKLLDDFLACETFAVAGYSSTGQSPANGIYDKLRAHGYRVYAVNPRHERVGDVVCYPNLAALPEKPDVVMICTAPAATDQVVRECATLGIGRVWMHRSVGQGSFSPAAARFCAEHGIACLPGGCPMMELSPDVAHRCMRWFVAGRVMRAAVSG